MLRPLALAFFVAAYPTLALAQSPASAVSTQSPTTRLLPVSGSVTDASGAPLAGTVTVTFTLYDAAENGSALWSEVQPVHADARGRYAAYLGAAEPVPQSVFSQEQARWLGVTVDGREQPRVMLVAVPYALRAADAETLNGRAASEFVTRRADGRLEAGEVPVDSPLIDGSGVPGQLAKFATPSVLGSSVITETATNRVGLLTTDPTGGGVVDSVFTIRNLDNNTGFAVLNETHARRFALNTGSDGSWTIYDGGNTTWNPGLRQRNGNVGIGGPPSTNQLRVIGGDDTAVFATATSGGRHALRGDGQDGSIAILGIAGSSLPLDVFANAAVLGYHTGGGAGVHGSSATGRGVFGFSSSGVGVEGGSSTGTAGRFTGNVVVTGTLSKGGGSFTIDHPLDPANKLLQHSFVESPDMLNVYNGNVTLDASGEAWVTLPGWFEALNRDFRYQLTAVGAPGPNLYVASEVAENKFKISGGTPGGRVSWQVTGVRQDAWANAHRIEVEKDKPANERGTYLHPELFGETSTVAARRDQ